MLKEKMDASRLTEIRRNQTLFFNSQLNPSELRRAVDNFDRLCVIEGGMPVIVHNTIQSDPQALLSTLESTGNTFHYSIDEAIYSTLGSFMSYNAGRSVGPTLCSRLYYLYLFSVTSAWAWTSGSTRVTGVKDGWDWSSGSRATLASQDDQFSWMIHVLAYIMPSFIPSYDSSGLLANERLARNWDDATQASETARIQAAGNWNAWKAAWDAWWSSRAADGYVAAQTAPADSDLPNGATVLDVSQSQDFTNAVAYPNPSQWTPLKVGGVKKNWLTMNWSTVRSTGLSGSDDTAIQTAAAAAKLTGTARTTELATLLALAQSLTDEQKIIAEFWAGGPNTVAPPGMFIWFWKEYVRGVNVAHSQSFETFFFSGLDLAIQLFEGGRNTWALKKTYKEARPIQEFRRSQANATLVKYDGTAIAGNLWIPYQMSNFVTPPFPDFPSGHSTFSQIFANVMGDWFGPAMPTLQVTHTDLKLLSPVLAASFTKAYNEMSVAAGSSEIQPGVVPAAGLTLQWSSWQDMADQAGVSRQYGGIHCQSAHVGGQTVANQLKGRARAAWGLSV
jgi:membrane-associated phospholipid phosphatase